MYVFFPTNHKGSYWQLLPHLPVYTLRVRVRVRISVRVWVRIRVRVRDRVRDRVRV